jgi:branched-chain amino acid transport system substrate-binding protein
MSKRLLVLVSVLIAASMLLAACGGAATAAPTSAPAPTTAPAATAAMPAATTAPAATSAMPAATTASVATMAVVPAYSGSPVATLKIVSDLPMTGSSLTQTQTIVNAEQLRLAEANNLACGGKYALSYEIDDDATAATGAWDGATETQNATKAAADKSVIAYLGTFNSGAAKLSIPITNQANDLLMFSPANTYPGLTHVAAGITAANEPNVYYPSGMRNYVRLAADDDLQGPVDVNFMVSLGIKSLYILNDTQAYGLGIANSVEQAAKAAGINVIGNEGYDTKASNYQALMTKISTSNNGNPPDMIFLGAVVDSNTAQVMKDKVSIMGDNTKVKFMGPDGLYTQAFIDGSGATVAEGAYASTPGVQQKDLNAIGVKFYADYAAKYGPTNEPYAVYGYDVMNGLLAAINDVCAAGGDPTDRPTVTKAVFALKDFQGALGTWSIDQNGDITLPYFLIGQAQSGKFVGIGTFSLNKK